MRTTSIIIIVCVMGFVNGSLAQKKTHFGIKVGMNLSKLEGDDVESADMKTGYHVGFILPIQTSDKFIIEPGLLLSAKGAKDSYEDSYEIEGVPLSSEFIVELRSHYLDIPVAFKYMVDTHLALSVSPMVSFLLSHKTELIEKNCVDGNCTGTKTEETDLDGISKSDFGVAIGIDYLVNRHVGLSASYQMGLKTMDKEFDGEVFNRVLGFSMSYIF